MLFLFYKILSHFKFPKIGAIGVFTGGVKSGKSAVSVAVTLSNYKRARRIWRFKCFSVKFFNLFLSKDKKLPFPEEPLIYSSIPLRYVNYVPLTREHLLRKRRFAYGSIVLIDEASLVADSQLIKDKEINTELLLFFKLFGHETRGGKCIVNTHCITDLHYALKRCTSQYFYIHSVSRYIPFFTVGNMREERYSEDATTVNAYTEDVEDTLKRFVMKKKTFKKYDSFCYSYLTDHLPYDTREDCVRNGKHDSLKAETVISFRPEFYNLKSRSDIENSLKEIKEHEKEKC